MSLLVAASLLKNDRICRENNTRQPYQPRRNHYKEFGYVSNGPFAGRDSSDPRFLRRPAPAHGNLPHPSPNLLDIESIEPHRNYLMSEYKLCILRDTAESALTQPRATDFSRQDFLLRVTEYSVWTTKSVFMDPCTQRTCRGKPTAAEMRLTPR